MPSGAVTAQLHAAKDVIRVARGLLAPRDRNDISDHVIFVCSRQPCARGVFQHAAKGVVLGCVLCSVRINNPGQVPVRVIGKFYTPALRVRPAAILPAASYSYSVALPFTVMRAIWLFSFVAVLRHAAFWVCHAQDTARAVILVERYGLPGAVIFTRFPSTS